MSEGMRRNCATSEVGVPMQMWCHAMPCDVRRRGQGCVYSGLCRVLQHRSRAVGPLSHVRVMMRKGWQGSSRYEWEELLRDVRGSGTLFSDSLLDSARREPHSSSHYSAQQDSDRCRSCLRCRMDGPATGHGRFCFQCRRL